MTKEEFKQLKEEFKQLNEEVTQLDEEFGKLTNKEKIEYETNLIERYQTKEYILAENDIALELFCQDSVPCIYSGEEPFEIYLKITNISPRNIYIPVLYYSKYESFLARTIKNNKTGAITPPINPPMFNIVNLAKPKQLKPGESIAFPYSWIRKKVLAQIISKQEQKASGLNQIDILITHNIHFNVFPYLYNSEKKGFLFYKSVSIRILGKDHPEVKK